MHSYFQHEFRIFPIKKFSNLRKIIWKLRIIFKDFLSSKMTKIRSLWFKCFAILLWLHSEVGICLWAVDNWININSSFDLHPIDNGINSISIGSEKVGKCSLHSEWKLKILRQAYFATSKGYFLVIGLLLSNELNNRFSCY